MAMEAKKMSQVERNTGAGIAPGLYAQWGRTYNRYHGDFPGFSGFGATLPLPAPLPVRSWPDGRRHTLPEVEATGRPEEARIYASVWFHVAYKQAQKPFSNRVQDRWINACNLFIAAHNFPYGPNQFAGMIATIKSANTVSDDAYRLQQQETQSPTTTAAKAADASFAPAVPVPPSSVSTGLPVAPTPTLTVMRTPTPTAPAKSITPTSTTSVVPRRKPTSGPSTSDPSTYLDFTAGGGTAPTAPGVKTPEVVAKAGFFANLPWWALPAGAAVGLWFAFGRR